MGIHKGTKLTDTPKDLSLKIRLDEPTNKKLIALSIKRGSSKAKVIRDGIDKLYAETMA